MKGLEPIIGDIKASIVELEARKKRIEEMISLSQSLLNSLNQELSVIDNSLSKLSTSLSTFESYSLKTLG